MGFLDGIKLLLDKGADVNVLKSRKGYEAYSLEITPLGLAALNGHGECVELLIELGADVNSSEEDANANLGRKICATAPLIAALENRHKECMEVLIKGRADVNGCNHVGSTAVGLAAGNGYYECLRLLLESGADVNRGCRGLSTPLISAALNGQTDCVKLLLKSNDINIDFMGEGGWTALMAAVYDAYHGCVILLLDAGADVNKADENGRTALHIAHGDYLNLIDVTNNLKLLLNAGAEIGHHEVECGIRLSPLNVLILNMCQISSKCVCMLYAAGDEVPVDFTLSDVYTLSDVEISELERKEKTQEVRRILQQLGTGETGHKAACRKVVRRHLMRMSRVNLFVRIPQLPLPRLMHDNVMYGESLEMSSDWETEILEEKFDSQVN